MATHVGLTYINKYFHNSYYFDNRETITVSIATNMTAHDVCVTQWNNLSVMWYLLHKSTSVAKESVRVCCELCNPMNHRNSQEWHMTVAARPSEN